MKRAAISFDNITQKIMILLLVIIATCSASVIQTDTQRVFASGMTDIRVGLVELYKDKSSVMIYNPKIYIGFCKNDSYLAETEFTSQTGFCFEPDQTGYYEDPSVYQSYSKAVSMCSTYSIGGGTAYPVYAGRNTWKCYITASSYNEMLKGSTKDVAQSFRKKNNTSYLIKVTGNGNVFLINGEDAGGFPQIKAAEKYNGGMYVNLGTRSYRGRIEIGRYKGSDNLTAVNILNIESYLLGVVTSEMDKTWPSEAIKAQALCSRSYAYARTGFAADSNLEKPYNIVDTTASQVYKGVQGESKAATDAVKATLGQIITYKGKTLDAFFFSTSGGATDSVMDIWSVKSTAYRAVFDFYENIPERKPWIYDFTAEEVKNKLKDADINVGDVISIEPEILLESGRIYKAKIKGTSGSVSVKGSKLKSIFKLPDIKCRVITASSNDDNVHLRSADGTTVKKLVGCECITADGVKKLSDSASQYILICENNYYNVPASLPGSGIFRFIGMGYGHGVGMSQSGARGMAEKGFKCNEIIDFYYKDVKIEKY